VRLGTQSRNELDLHVQGDLHRRVAIDVREQCGAPIQKVVLSQYRQREADTAKRQTIHHLDDTLKIIVRAIDNSGATDSGGA
jgi:hypothetical protein